MQRRHKQQGRGGKGEGEEGKKGRFEDGRDKIVCGVPPVLKKGCVNFTIFGQK